MAVKLNNADNYESLGCITLTKEKYPIAFKAKVEELLEEELCKTEEEAEKLVTSMEIELEIYYEKGYGLFAVECGAVEGGSVISPYTGEECEAADD